MNINNHLSQTHGGGGGLQNVHSNSGVPSPTTGGGTPTYHLNAALNNLGHSNLHNPALNSNLNSGLGLSINNNNPHIVGGTHAAAASGFTG